MRTTIDIAEDVLLAAKELASRQKKTAGQVISELARQSLTRLPHTQGPDSSREAGECLGFRPFASRGAVVTNGLIANIREDDIY